MSPSLLRLSRTSFILDRSVEPGPLFATVFDWLFCKSISFVTRDQVVPSASSRLRLSKNAASSSLEK